MIITLKNLVVVLGSLLLLCAALSYAMANEPSPTGQLTAKVVKEEDSQFNELPLEVVHYMTEFLNEADYLHLMQTSTFFNDKLRVLLFKKIRSAACQGCWKVPRRDDGYYEAVDLYLLRAVFFNIVSQSDVVMLILALSFIVSLDDENRGKYLECKKYSLAIAKQNEFTRGVAILQRAFNMTPEEYQELVGNIKFPLTENLLIAAIHLISPLELAELLNGQDVSFDPSLNDDAILKALVHAVHHRKIDHVKVLFNCQYIKSYFLPDGTRLLCPYIEYSCKNFGDASFIEFLIEKQPKNILLLVDMFGDCLKTYHRTYALFKIYVITPEYFQTSFHDYFVSNSPLFWVVEPEELFVMLQDCNLDILPWISDASWELFARTRYNNGAVECLLQTCCHEENLSVSARAYWEKIATKFNANRKSLGQDLSLENETFLLVFIKYFCNDYSRFVKFVDFLNYKSLFCRSLKRNILTHFHGMQDQSFLLHLRGIGFASFYCSIL